MLLCLKGYDMNITYHIGKEMILADGLSRFPNKRKNAIDLDIKIDFVQYSTEKLT